MSQPYQRTRAPGSLTSAAGRSGAARSAKRPLAQLERAVSAFLRGDADLPLPTTARGETGSLARAFRDLRETMRERSRALAASEAHLRAVVDHMVDALVVIDPLGRVERFNRAAEVLFGYSAEDVFGKNVSTLMPEPRASEHDGYIERYLETGEARIMGTIREVEGLRRDGSTFPLELSVAEFTVGDERRFVGALRDVTERKRQERTVHEALVAAEAANVAKTYFLANMSHELRTPLNAIIGYADLLIEEFGFAGRTESGPLHDLGRIKAAGEDLLKLVNDVLDFSRIEAGEMGVDLKDVEVAPLIESVVRTIRPLAECYGNHLDAVLAADLGTVRSDAAKLHQILLNLLANAAKFTRDGTIRIEACRESANAGKRLVLRVIDSGIGMDESFLARIFQPFAQADPSATRAHGGTGLGLAITRQSCHLLGGTIEVESRPGQGSTFTVRLPADAVATTL